MYLRQDYVFFIPPPPHHRGTRSAFSPSIDACWYGRVNLIFKIRVRTDAGPVMECQCALIDTLFDYCPREGRDWYPRQTYTDRYRQIQTDTCTVLLCEFPIHAYINTYKQIHAICTNTDFYIRAFF